MKKKFTKFALPAVLLIAGLMLSSLPVGAAIPGISGPSFNLTAKIDCIYGGDGLAIVIWGYANGAARAQYPGPTLFVNQGDAVSVILDKLEHPRTRIDRISRTGRSRRNRRHRGIVNS